MSKTQTAIVAEPHPTRTDAPSMSPSVRRHLGKSLRSHYAGSLSEPMTAPFSERLEALLAKLAGQG